MSRPSLRSDDRGASAVEYAILLVGIAAVVVALVFAVGNSVNDMFSDTCAPFDEQRQSTEC